MAIITHGAADVGGTLKGDAVSAGSGVASDDGYGFDDYGNHFVGLQYDTGSGGILNLNSYGDTVVHLDTNDNDPNKFVVRARPLPDSSGSTVDVLTVEETGDVTVTGTVTGGAISGGGGVGADDGYGFDDTGNWAAGLQYDNGQLFMNSQGDVIANLDTNDNSPNSFIVRARPEPDGSGSTEDVLTIGETGAARFTGNIILNEMTKPAGITDTAQLYAADLAGTGHLYSLDAGGNETKISPHNEDNEWEYYSMNRKTGRVFRVNMERMIRKLEEFTGETFIEDE